MYAAQAFIQWKGTDVCCDFECTCGNYAHIDGYFMYYVKCGACGRTWKSPWHMMFEQIDAPDDGSIVIEIPAEKDDE